MSQIGFIGTGEIAEAMVHALAARGHKILVSERSAVRAAALSDQYANVRVVDNQSVLDGSEYVCLCLMKDVANSILPGLEFGAEQKIISVMVDVSVEQLHQLCAPATNISITIPLPFVATGGCPLPVYPDTGSVAELFGEENLVLAMASQNALNAHFAATAMASGLFAQMQTLTKWLAGMTGDEQAAEAYVIAMLGGYASSLPTDGQGRIAEALQALSTEGGLNATLRAHLDDAGVQEALITGLDGFKSRLGLD